MTEIPPEIIQLIEAGFGVLFLVGIILFIKVASKAVQPFATMTSFIQQSQRHLEENQRELGKVIDQNTKTLRIVGDSISELVTKILDSDKILATNMLLMQDAQNQLAQESLFGVMILDEKGNVILYSDSALNLLGWTVEHLPTKGNRDIPDILNATGEKIGVENWPATLALATNRPVRNIPMQIYSPQRRNFIWALVSAYPCAECKDGGHKWVTVILRKLEELGKVI